jgi:hypothetical protein
MWMRPAAKLVSVFFQLECNASKPVVPYQINLTLGLHLPIGRPSTSGCPACCCENRTNNKTFLLKSLRTTLWK